MTIMVSSSSLPLSGIHSLAFLLDRSNHLLGRNVVERACEGPQHCTALALRCRRDQRHCETEHLLLHFEGQLVVRATISFLTSIRKNLHFRRRQLAGPDRTKPNGSGWPDGFQNVKLSSSCKISGSSKPGLTRSGALGR